MTRFYFGLDLGQSFDPTALAILERIETTKVERDPVRKCIAYDVKGPVRYNCGHMERLPLNTRYPAIVEYAGKMLEASEFRGQSTLVIDASGVGKPVADLFTQARIPFTGVIITGGDSVNRDGNIYRVPKRHLVSTLQVLLQAERLDIAPHAEREALVNELQNFRVTITEAANDTYGGRSGTHDDLVLAVALAAWHAESNTSGETFVGPGLDTRGWQKGANGWEKIGHRTPNYIR